MWFVIGYVLTWVQLITSKWVFIKLTGTGRVTNYEDYVKTMCNKETTTFSNLRDHINFEKPSTFKPQYPHAYSLPCSPYIFYVMLLVGRI